MPVHTNLSVYTCIYYILYTYTCTTLTAKPRYPNIRIGFPSLELEMQSLEAGSALIQCSRGNALNTALGLWFEGFIMNMSHGNRIKSIIFHHLVITMATRDIFKRCSFIETKLPK